MIKRKVFKVIGLMSGTSMDGIDVSVVDTDGRHFFKSVSDLTIPYSDEFRVSLRKILGGSGPIQIVSDDLTFQHAEAVKEILNRNKLSVYDVDIIGFHGHTILHKPEKEITWQIGDGKKLAKLTSINVVADFRSDDVAKGGEGAPLTPLFHTLIAPQERPLCVLNLGGVSNITWVGRSADVDSDNLFENLLAFDSGPGNALINDWVETHYKQPFDYDGAIASEGAINKDIVKELMKNDYFDRLPPKSLDRQQFNVSILKQLSPADGAATLSAFTAQSIKRAVSFLPEPPKLWVVVGGGRHNHFLMSLISDYLDSPVIKSEVIGLNGDYIESQAFAYLAVRSLKRLPISGPSTTGVSTPLTGGHYFQFT